jgi:Flp pilus assembly protein TadD
VTELRKAVDMDPGFTQSHQYLGAAYALERKQQEAATELEQALKLSQRGLLPLTWAGATYAFMGRREEAQKLIRRRCSTGRSRDTLGRYGWP